MSNTALPEGWTWVTLNDLGEWYGGGTPSKKEPAYWTDGHIPWLSPKDMGPDVLTETQDHITQAAVQGSAVKVVPEGSVAVVTRSGILERTVPVALVPFATTLNQDMKAIVPHAGISARWLAHAVRARESVILGTCRRDGTTVASLATDAFQKLPMTLPPTREQDRIADEVERRLSHVDAAERTIERALRRIEQAQVSLLNAAARGDLMPTCGGETLAPRLAAAGAPFEPVPGRDGWVRVRIDTIAKVGSGVTPKRGVNKYWHGGNIPWVTSGQLLNTRVTEPAQYITQAALDETSVKLWPAGTLLVAMYGEGRTRGHCAELTFDATCNQACAAINLKPGFEDLQAFLHLVLDARYEENRSLGSGGVQENLNLGLIKGIEVELPPDQCRDALVAEARRRISLLDAARATITRQLARCAAARSSILTAAFTGQLVPPDPSDEPATVLLERIKEQRETTAPTKKPARRPRAKEETIK